MLSCSWSHSMGLTATDYKVKSPRTLNNIDNYVFIGDAVEHKGVLLEIIIAHVLFEIRYIIKDKMA